MLILNGKRFYPETADPKALGFAYHAENTTTAMKKFGAQFINTIKDKQPDIVFHQAPAHTINRIDGIPNVLYTAYEALDLPQDYIDNAKKMDLIICVSDFVSKAFRRAIGRDIPVLTCNLGVDVEKFKYKKRSICTDYPFTFLWVGAPNMRKGWSLIKEAWKQGGFYKRSDCCLYVKTSGKGVVENLDNVIMDSRKISVDQLVDIYHTAHCFLFPSYSEGFGLTLAEAMSTGLPCIYTPWGGVNDFIDNKTGYKLSYKVVPVNYSIPTTAAEAKIEDIISCINTVMRNYSKALQKGKRASRKIERSFTWDHTGKNIMSILNNFVKRQVKK